MFRDLILDLILSIKVLPNNSDGIMTLIPGRNAHLIHFDGRVNNSGEAKASNVADGPGKDEKGETNNSIVAEIKEGGGELDDVKFGIVIIRGIEEHPVSGRTGN